MMTSYLDYHSEFSYQYPSKGLLFFSQSKPMSVMAPEMTAENEDYQVARPGERFLTPRLTLRPMGAPW